MPSEKIFIIKKDKYLSLDTSLNTINYENTIYPITEVKKIGSKIKSYLCDAGILEISNSSKRISKWNGITIMMKEPFL